MGFITHRIVYGLRADLNIVLLFPLERGAATLKNIYYILFWTLFLFILFFFSYILWVLPDPICHGKYNFQENYFFSPTQRGEIVSSLRTVDYGQLLYKSVFSSVLALKCAKFNPYWWYKPCLLPPPANKILQLADYMENLDVMGKLEILL